MKSAEGRRLHSLAAQAREQGDSVEALKLCDEAIDVYQRDGDRLGFSECYAEKAIVLSHKADKTDDEFFKKLYLIDARKNAEIAVEAAELSGEKTALAIPYLRLGRAHEDLEELPEAVLAYKKAVENINQNPPAAHNRAAVVADFKNHLACANINQVISPLCNGLKTV